ncbi:hypothetical protein [Streptomyces ureilyticus]|uniref:Biotin transporter BioY n=1 Tax=Streptomyces ureilyticus TaxID=1775131 RepID=A0ABX0DPX1_9ACTN|nr:hypothetical protein [Streptomyces ureilyticus]NGO43773.1 hypothetical protein [Streptomyces ureilyticus]
MKPIAFGAVLGVLWLVFGLPSVPLAGVLPVLVQPVTVAFAAGHLIGPRLARSRGWTA